MSKIFKKWLPKFIKKKNIYFHYQKKLKMLQASFNFVNKFAFLSALAKLEN